MHDNKMEAIRTASLPRQARMMQQLVIEYVMDGHRPGYQFTSPQNGLSKASLQSIWRQAMPRGQGWGLDGYQGARSLKCFPVAGGQIAASVVTVTGQQDEMGRRGIRRAEISVMPAKAYAKYLADLQASFPADIQEAARRQMTAYFWRRLLNKIVPRLKAHKQVILTHAYTTPQAWQVMELLMLRVVTSPAVRMLEGWGTATPFTTLALDWREEARIVALPLAQSERLRGVAAIRIP